MRIDKSLKIMALFSILIFSGTYFSETSILKSLSFFNCSSFTAELSFSLYSVAADIFSVSFFCLFIFSFEFFCSVLFCIYVPSLISCKRRRFTFLLFIYFLVLLFLMKINFSFFEMVVTNNVYFYFDFHIFILILRFFIIRVQRLIFSVLKLIQLLVLVFS